MNIPTTALYCIVIIFACIEQNFSGIWDIDRTYLVFSMSLQRFDSIERRAFHLDTELLEPRFSGVATMRGEKIRLRLANQ